MVMTAVAEPFPEVQRDVAEAFEYHAALDIAFENAAHFQEYLDDYVPTVR